VQTPHVVPEALTTIDSHLAQAVLDTAIETTVDIRTTAPALLEAEEWFSVGTLERPAYLMCTPFSHSVDQPNNIWMTEYEGDEGKLDRRRGLVQFLDLYNYVAADALVYLLPSRPRSGLQDEVFTANLAFVPEHLPGRDLAIVSRFTSAPRQGETALGTRFFEAMGYRTVVAPFRFEGEAEIKHLHDNVYVGGYGERTDPNVYDWMAEQFDMEIVRVAEVDPYLYHLDCSVFPLSSEETLVCTEKFTPAEVKALEKVTGIVDVPEDAAFNGICNSLRLHNMILNASDIRDLKAGTEDYALEVAKNRLLEDICAERAFEPVFFNLSEYLKSGALLSCMVLHLNRFSYTFRLM
jgi:N-dimethylarginine dimethylaminohydrolase